MLTNKRYNLCGWIKVPFTYEIAASSYKLAKQQAAELEIDDLVECIDVSEVLECEIEDLYEE